MTDTQNSTVSILREDLALLVEPASHKERISIRRHEAMFKLRAILAQPADPLIVKLTGPQEWLDELAKTAAGQQDEPVAYQYRERPCWVEGNLFSPWAPCDKGFHDSVLREPLKLKFQREARALYLRPAARAVKLPDSIAAFAIDMITGSPEGGLLDAYDIQEMAVKHGLLTIVETNEPCRPDGCQCAEYGFPAECYRHTDVMRDAVARLNGIKP